MGCFSISKKKEEKMKTGKWKYNSIIAQLNGERLFYFYDKQIISNKVQGHRSCCNSCSAQWLWICTSNWVVTAIWLVFIARRPYAQSDAERMGETASPSVQSVWFSDWAEYMALHEQIEQDQLNKEMFGNSIETVCLWIDLLRSVRAHSIHTIIETKKMGNLFK